MQIRTEKGSSKSPSTRNPVKEGDRTSAPFPSIVPRRSRGSFHGAGSSTIDAEVMFETEPINLPTFVKTQENVSGQWLHGHYLRS